MTKKTDLLQVPDAIGDIGRAELVSRMFMQIQEQRANLQLEQIANELADDDLAPNQPRVGAKETVGEKRYRLNKAEQAILDANRNLLPLIEKIVAKLQDQTCKQLDLEQS